jgi:hypothetical protein
MMNLSNEKVSSSWSSAVFFREIRTSTFMLANELFICQRTSTSAAHSKIYVQLAGSILQLH